MKLVDLVLDASALLRALLLPSDGGRTLRRRIARSTCHAPHLIDAEVGSVLRRRTLRGELAPDDALELLDASTPLVDHRYDMAGVLARRAWAVTDNVGFYDGLYVALAQSLRVPLLTADSRLAGAPDLGIEVELVAAPS